MIIDENAGVEDLGGAAEEQELNDDSRAPEDQEDNTDWKAVALKERERGDNYKTALDQKRGLRNKGKAPTPESDDNDDDDGDKPISRNEFERILQETVVPIIAGNRVDTVLAEKVKDPAKREAVKAIYENRVRLTGTSDEDVRFDIDAAIAIANSHRNSVSAAETERINNRDVTPPLNGSGADRGVEPKGHKFSAEQVRALEAQARSIGADPKKFIEQAYKNTKKG